MFKEFKEFAVKGNMVDMAVGIIIGAAFGGVVGSLVKDIISPIIGLLGKADFSNWFIVLKPIGGHFDTLKAATDAHAIVLSYGVFITTLINFIIVAFAIFLVVKVVNKLRKQQPATPAAPTAQENLLTEIRDLLKK